MKKFRALLLLNLSLIAGARAATCQLRGSAVDLKRLFDQGKLASGLVQLANVAPGGHCNSSLDCGPSDFCHDQVCR